MSIYYEEVPKKIKAKIHELLEKNGFKTDKFNKVLVNDIILSDMIENYFQLDDSAIMELKQQIKEYGDDVGLERKNSDENIDEKIKYIEDKFKEVQNLEKEVEAITNTINKLYDQNKNCFDGRIKIELSYNWFQLENYENINTEIIESIIKIYENKRENKLSEIKTLKQEINKMLS